MRADFEALVGERIEAKPLFQEVQRVVSTRPALRQRLLSMIESHELKAIESARPMPGAVEVVYSLFEVSRLALVTLQSRAVCEEILRRHKLLDLFEATVTREESLDRSAQLEAVLNRLGVRPRDALFVGDRLNDVVCARKVGVAVAIVGGGVPKEPKPDYSFTGLADLKAFFP